MKCILCGSPILLDENTKRVARGWLCECCHESEYNAMVAEEKALNTAIENTGPGNEHKNLIGKSYRTWEAMELGRDK